MDEAAEVWQQLINKDPRGPLAPEARFRYGEYLFLEFELEMAEVQYRAVVSSQDPTFADKAYYKLGWTLYLMERYEEAVDTFVALVDLQSGAGAEGEKLSMRKEALQFIAFSFSERGGLEVSKI